MSLKLNSTTMDLYMDTLLAATRFEVGAAQPAFRDRSNQEVRPALLEALAGDAARAVAIFMPRGDLLSSENLRSIADPEALSRMRARSLSTYHTGAHGSRRTAIEALLDCPSLKAALRVSRVMPRLTDSQTAYALWTSADPSLLSSRLIRARQLGWLDEAALRALAAREDTQLNGSRVAALGGLALLEARRLEGVLIGCAPTAAKFRI